MDNTQLFTAALGLEHPWKVSKVEFIPEEADPKVMALHITVTFERGGKFIFYNEDGSVWTDPDGNPIETTAHDTVVRTWQHLNFFQYKTYIHVKMPRVSDGEGHCPTVKAPWARKNSGFTLLFEAWVVELARHLPVSVIARLVGVRDKRLWHFIKHYVNAARELEDYSRVDSIGMDVTSKKDHNYITVMVDLSERKVIYTTEGKEHTTIDKFVSDFKEHNGSPNRIRLVTCDMSLGFWKGVKDNFPNSNTIIDKFHVIKHANDANLTDRQAARKANLLKASRRLKTGRIYSMRVALQDIYE